MKKTGFIFIISFFVAACTDENDSTSNEKATFFPVLSYLKSRVAHIDTSLYTLIKIVKEDNRTDTAYIKREEFKKHAQDFITLPDITSKNLRKGYTEAKFFDQDLQKVVLNYTPNDLKAEIRRQDVIVQPNTQTGDMVETIFIDRLLEGKDSTIQKKMTWEVNKRFRIITIIQKRGQKDKIKITDLIWNDFPAKN